MAYALAILCASLILGGIGNANRIPALSELATVGVLAALIMFGRALWQLYRGRHQRTERQP